MLISFACCTSFGPEVGKHGLSYDGHGHVPREVGTPKDSAAKPGWVFQGKLRSESTGEVTSM